MLYYIDGTIPNTKPKRIRLPNGLTVTNPDDETLFSLGWKIAPEVPSATYPNQVQWDGGDWIIVPPSESDVASKWESVRQQCLQKLAESDYRVIKAIEMSIVNGTTVDAELPMEYITYRQALRDIYNNVNNIDPFFVEWPTIVEVTNAN